MPNRLSHSRNLFLVLALLLGLIGMNGGTVLAGGTTTPSHSITVVRHDDGTAEPPAATNTDVPPTATSTDVPPTATDIPPTATDVPPTATDVPATATDVPATATPTAIPPTATDVPPTATATEIAPTAVPPSGGLDLAFADLDTTANPGETVSRSLTISNGVVAQSISLEIHSSHNWTLTVTNSLTHSTLTDSNADDIYQLGSFAPYEAGQITIALHIPTDASPGTDTLTVSVPDRPEIDPVRVTTTIAAPTPTPTATTAPSVSVEIAGTGASFGTMNMNGTLDPTIPDLTSSVDSTGASYIKKGAIRITVTSTTSWTLHCSLSGSDALNGRGGLTWRANPDTAWQTFGNDATPSVCASGKPGKTVVIIDLRLHVDLNEPAVPLTGTIQISWDQ